MLVHVFVCLLSLQGLFVRRFVGRSVRLAVYLTAEKAKVMCDEHLTELLEGNLARTHPHTETHTHTHTRACAHANAHLHIRAHLLDSQP